MALRPRASDVRVHDGTSQNTSCNRPTPDQNFVVPGSGVRSGSSNSSRMPLTVTRIQRFGNQFTPNVQTLSLLGRMCCGTGVGERRAGFIVALETELFVASAQFDGADAAGKQRTARIVEVLLVFAGHQPRRAHVPPRREHVRQVAVSEALIVPFFARLHPFGRQTDRARACKLTSAPTCVRLPFT